MVQGNPKKQEIVREEELKRYLLAQARVVKAQIEFSRAKRDFEDIRESLVDRVREGCRFVGTLVATIENVAGPARPRWKEIALEIAERFGLQKNVVEAQAILSAQQHRLIRQILIIATKQ
jgi:hypothetical protein